MITADELVRLYEETEPIVKEKHRGLFIYNWEYYLDEAQEEGGVSISDYLAEHHPSITKIWLVDSREAELPYLGKYIIYTLLINAEMAYMERIALGRKLRELMGHAGEEIVVRVEVAGTRPRLDEARPYSEMIFFKENS